MAHSDDVTFDELVARQKPGMSLEQPFYTDPAIFDREMADVLPGQWLFVEHVTALPDKGDYVLYDIAGESIIIVRGRDGEIRAFYNVCRHRGSRVCLAPQG
ncbi:MAG: aromatic ring-hydroxylating oxygenase subunit alpha, partial [Alphaproteobacteria bacterium]